jgi:hypothetical protein
MIPRLLGLFENMLARMERSIRRRIGDAVRLIDSTGLRLAGVGAERARFSTSIFRAKAHALRPQLDVPLKTSPR